MRSFKNGMSFLFLVISFTFLLYGLLLNEDRNNVHPQHFCDFRCAFTPRSSMDSEVKDMKNLTALAQNLRNNLEILRFSNRSTGFANLHSLVDHQMHLIDHLLGIDNWRQEVSQKLSKKIKSRMEQLQNPKDCSSAPKLYCDMRNEDGLASGVHDILWCATNAYLNSSLLVVMSKHWHYTTSGWDTLFKPISGTCRTETEPKTPWPGHCDDSLRRNLSYLPAEYADELLLLGSNPLPWWYGQLLGNLLKPSNNIEEKMAKRMKELGFASPIVGLHIRRTDKIGIEGAFHSVEEYMVPVKHYYDTLVLGGHALEVRRVFVATDEPAAIKELQERYNGYTFLFNPNSAQSAENLDTRYKEESVEAAIIDLFMLSKVDYLVCSLSSGFSRLAYELMLFDKPEALDNVHSVDTEYFYAGCRNPSRMAVFDHRAEANDELNLTVGDILVQPYFNSLQDDATKGKVFDGYSRGLNERTGQTGNYPLYKTKPVFQLFD